MRILPEHLGERECVTAQTIDESRPSMEKIEMIRLKVRQHIDSCMTWVFRQDLEYTPSHLADAKVTKYVAHLWRCFHNVCIDPTLALGCLSQFEHWLKIVPFQLILKVAQVRGVRWRVEVNDFACWPANHLSQARPELSYEGFGSRASSFEGRVGGKGNRMRRNEGLRMLKRSRSVCNILSTGDGDSKKNEASCQQSENLDS